MSLVRQLWLAIILITVTTFAGSFLVSMFSASSYLEQQLLRKNLDNANSLALSISQQSKDPVTVELLVAALFDNGHYQSITVRDPNGAVIVGKVQDRSDSDVPGWFIRLFPIRSLPGRAQITDGWKQYGTVTVISHNRFAYQALWQQLLAMGSWYILIAVLGGLVGMLVLRNIKRPLAAVVEQARAIMERRFLSIAEPRTPELRSMARAMNEMVARLRNMFADEAHQLEVLQQQLNFDTVTSLANRGYFMSRVHERLESETETATGALLLLRLVDLTGLNNRLGRATTDELLRNMGDVFRQLIAELPASRLAGRLNGSDFALFAPSTDDTEALARQLAEAMIQATRMDAFKNSVLFHVGAIPYHRGDHLGSLLGAADEALAVAQSKGAYAWHAETTRHVPIATGNAAWRELLTGALTAGRLKLVFYPVNTSNGESMHLEGMARLQAQPDGNWLTAGDFMPMAERLNLSGMIDLAVIQRALTQLQTQAGELAINLSAETMADWEFRNQLDALLLQHRALCPRLWFEVPEYGVFSAYEAFRDMCHVLKQLGCKIGIEHFGHQFNDVQRVAELGLDYLKVDASLVRDIGQRADNQQILKRLCHMAHSLGMRVIAVGVQNLDEQTTLIELGIDGLTGPFIKAAG